MRDRVLNCGYVALVDSAPLIIAKELGFAADEGLSLNLLRQPSWAALRDLLSLGHLDVAHMLSPMPAAMSLGLSGAAVQIDAPLVMSANGTVLAASLALTGRLKSFGWRSGDTSPHSVVKALGRLLDSPLRVGVPFPHSMHRLLFEYLVQGLPSDARAQLTVVTMPPSLMADAVDRGEIDLFCVGEPWGTVATNSGVAELILPNNAIWAHAPEKVLGMARHWHERNDEACGAIMRAVCRACQWLDQPQNRPLASEILARSEHLDLPDQAIDPALTGRLLPGFGQKPWEISNFLKFHGEATTFPWRSQGAWIGAGLSALYDLDAATATHQAAECFRPDLYRRHLEKLHQDMPGASAKVEGALTDPRAVPSTRGQMILGPDAFFDGKTFEFDLQE